MKFPLTITLQHVQILLNESEYFRRYNGADHLVLNSFRSFGYKKSKTKTKKISSPNFLLDMCKECLKTCFYKYRSHSSRFIPIPYASSFHYHDNVSAVPWISSKKTILLTYVGGWKTDMPSSASLRHTIVNTCQKSKKCVAKRLMHQDNVLKKYKYHEYRNSIFCLQPPGDDPSRKGVMDSLLSGCIPVTFHPDTLITALPLHLSVTEAKEISVFIPEHIAQNTSSFNIVSFIESIPEADITKKQQKIASLGYRLQYSVPPLIYLQNRSDETPWDPPFPDGVDVMLNGMISLADKLKMTKNTTSLSSLSDVELFAYPYDSVTSNQDLRHEYAVVMY